MAVAACGSAKPAAHASSQNARVAPLYYDTVGEWGDTWTSNQWASAYDGAVLTIFVQMPLAGAINGSPNHYIPLLASSWSIKGRSVAITIHAGAKWQNGQRVTSKDILTTMLIDGMEGANGLIWPSVSSVRTPNSRELVVEVKHPYSPETVLTQLMQLVPVPTSQYGRLLPPGSDAQLEQDIYLENQTVKGSTNPTPAATAEATHLDKYYKDVANYHPSTVIGDGPFRFVGQNSEAANLKKWSGFYGSASVHVPSIIVQQLPDQGQFTGLAKSHRLDYVQKNPSTMLEVGQLKRAGVGFTISLPEYTYNLYFNVYHYPFTNKSVRQAVAYVLNQHIQAMAGVGSSRGLKTTRYFPSGDGLITGLNGGLVKGYLPKSVKGSLNPYAYFPTRAANLLTHAGFHKVHGKWELPNGKPFEVPIATMSGQGVATDALHAASLLTRFGITAPVSSYSLVTEYSLMSQGELNGLFFDWDSGGITPFDSFLPLVSEIKAPKAADYVHVVPGIGRVNVLNALTSESGDSLNGTQAAHLYSDWAKYFNSEVDALTFGSGVEVYMHSTSSYVGWPSPQNSAWNMINVAYGNALGVIILRGLIRPR